MFCIHILLMTFLNEPEVICLHTVKWFHVFLSNTNNSIYISHLITLKLPKSSISNNSI